MKGSGECGTLFLAEPLDACAPLTNKLVEESQHQAFVLIARGVCSFEDKVRRAQSAGFKAAIVYNNDDSDLVASMILLSVCFYIIIAYIVLSIFCVHAMITKNLLCAF